MLQAVVPGGQSSGNVHLSKGGVTSITVPAGKEYHLQWGILRYVATADVLTRFCSARARYTSGAIDPILILASLAPTASQDVFSQFGPHLASGTGIILTNSYAGAPLVIPAGFVITVTVDAGAPAGDDWTFDCLYYTVPAVR